MSYRLFCHAIVASVAVSAIAGCTSGPPASNAGGAQSGAGVPQPGGLAATIQRDGTHVTFSWQPVSGAVHYNVFVFDNPVGPPVWMWWGTETRVVFGGAPFTVPDRLQQLSRDVRPARPPFGDVALPANPSWAPIALDAADRPIAVKPTGPLQ